MTDEGQQGAADATSSRRRRWRKWPWILLGVLLIPVWRRGPVGHTFKWFTASYLAFRLLVDTIKPGVAVLFGLTAIQWACVCGLLYYAQWFAREGSRAWVDGR